MKQKTLSVTSRSFDTVNESAMVDTFVNTFHADATKQVIRVDTRISNDKYYVTIVVTVTYDEIAPEPAPIVPILTPEVIEPAAAINSPLEGVTIYPDNSILTDDSTSSVAPTV